MISLAVKLRSSWGGIHRQTLADNLFCEVRLSQLVMADMMGTDCESKIVSCEIILSQPSKSYQLITRLSHENLLSSAREDGNS